MVCHLLYTGIECEIIAQDKPLHEHEVKTEESTDPKDGIPKEAATIKITVKDSHKLDCPALWFCAFIDGERVDGPVLTKQEFALLSEWWEFIDGATVGKSIRPFLFSKIATTSENRSPDETKKLKQRLSNIGDIIVKVYRQGNGGQAFFDEDTPFREADYNSEISEVALKGKIGDVSHGTSLGEARPVQGAARWVANLIDGIEKPIATFCFKYRSQEKASEKMFRLADPSANVIDLAEDAEEEESVDNGGSENQVESADVKEAIDNLENYKSFDQDNRNQSRGSTVPGVAESADVEDGDTRIIKNNSGVSIPHIPTGTNSELSEDVEAGSAILPSKASLQEAGQIDTHKSSGFPLDTDILITTLARAENSSKEILLIKSENIIPNNSTDANLDTGSTKSVVPENLISDSTETDNVALHGANLGGVRSRSPSLVSVASDGTLLAAIDPEKGTFPDNKNCSGKLVDGHADSVETRAPVTKEASMGAIPVSSASAIDSGSKESVADFDGAATIKVEKAKGIQNLEEQKSKVQESAIPTHVNHVLEPEVRDGVRDEIKNEILDKTEIVMEDIKEEIKEEMG